MNTDLSVDEKSEMFNVPDEASIVVFSVSFVFIDNSPPVNASVPARFITVSLEMLPPDTTLNFPLCILILPPVETITPFD